MPREGHPVIWRRDPFSDRLVSALGIARSGGNPGPHLTMEEVDRKHIRRVLKMTGWRVRGSNGAAEMLGVKPTTLESRMAKLGIHRRAEDRPK